MARQSDDSAGFVTENIDHMREAEDPALPVSKGGTELPARSATAVQGNIIKSTHVVDDAKLA